MLFVLPFMPTEHTVLPSASEHRSPCGIPRLTQLQVPDVVTVSRSPSSALSDPFFGWEGSPSKIDPSKIRIPFYSSLSNLEDLVPRPHIVGYGCGSRPLWYCFGVGAPPKDSEESRDFSGEWDPEIRGRPRFLELPPLPAAS